MKRPNGAERTTMSDDQPDAFSELDEFGELDEILREFEAALELLVKDPTSKDAQCQVCLISRSAYTEFYSVSEVKGELDQRATKRLQDLLVRALALLNPEDRYRQSVEQRMEEFEAFCDEIPKRPEFDTAVLS